MTKPIVIGVDVSVLKRNLTGVKTYLEELSREFKRLNDPGIVFKFLDNPLPVYKGRSKAIKAFAHIGYQLWKQMLLPIKARVNKCDIIFCVDDCVPYVHLGYQTVQVIHDAFCFEMPENYGSLWLKLYKSTTIPGAKRAAFVIAPTAYSKKQIARYISLPADKIAVIPEAPKRIDHIANIPAAEDLFIKFSIEKSKYLLHVGSMFKRKNLPRLVNAFAMLKDKYPDIKLVLAGSLVTNSHDNDYDSILQLIKGNNLTDKVIITGYVSDAQISQLYKNALIYVFPSLNEGFGLPVLEALEHNLPVLVADNTCLPEVGGNAVISFDPLDVTDIAKKIETVLADKTLRAKMIDQGQERLKNFSWRRTAEEIVGLFKTAANSRKTR